MKNKHIELMRRTMRNFHRNNPWKLDGGLFVPHGYLQALLVTLPLAQTADDYEALLPWSIVLPPG